MGRINTALIARIRERNTRARIQPEEIAQQKNVQKIAHGMGYCIIAVVVIFLLLHAYGGIPTIRHYTAKVTAGNQSMLVYCTILRTQTSGYDHLAITGNTQKVNGQDTYLTGSYVRETIFNESGPDVHLYLSGMVMKEENNRRTFIGVDLENTVAHACHTAGYHYFK